MSDSLQPHWLQHAKLPCPLSGVYSGSCPLSHWFHPTISSSVISFSSHLQSFPDQDLFKWVSSSHQVAKVLEFQLQHQSFQWIFKADFLQDGLAWSPCCPRDFQGSFPTPQFKSINPSFLCFPTFTSILTSTSMTTGKTLALTRRTFFGKVMSLLFNMVSSLVMEKAVATHSSTLAWKITWTEEPGRLQSMESLRVGHDWETSLSFFTFMFWRRKWQPTPVFLPGESQGWGSLVGCRLWGRTESDTTEAA